MLTTHTHMYINIHCYFYCRLKLWCNQLHKTGVKSMIHQINLGFLLQTANATVSVVLDLDQCLPALCHYVDNRQIKNVPRTTVSNSIFKWICSIKYLNKYLKHSLSYCILSFWQINCFWFDLLISAKFIQVYI